MEIRDVVFSEIRNLMASDESIVILTADHGAFVLDDIKNQYPDRVYNVGISEQNMIEVAAGLALDGKRPYVYAIINFTTFRCLEQINIDISMMNLPITILGVGSGFCYSTDGPTHHGVQDIGIMKMIPSLSIYNVSDSDVATRVVQDAYRYGGPSYIRFDKGDYNNSSDTTTCCGHNVINMKYLNDKVVVSTGTLIHSLKEFSDEMKFCLIDVFQLKPLPDLFTYIYIKEMLVIEEHFIDGGLGTILLEEVNKQNSDIKIKRIGINNTHSFLYGSREQMLNKNNLSIDSIKEKINVFLQK